MTLQLITEVTFLPDGMELTDFDAMSFSIKVIYRGTYVRRSAEKLGNVHWYGVEHMFHLSLSRAGNWASMIDRFQRWQYRFTYEEAIPLAEDWVNRVKTNGRTWAEWQAFHAEQV